jgi:glycosyltransferase involved in cell wall biosynthesis
MGKNKKANKKPNNISTGGFDNSKYPFVSVCTPTFNRRPFFSAAIKCFQNQDYPKERMEWIIIDDGTDKIEELVLDIPQVKYFKYDKKLTLGRKRNLMHEKSKGEIIVYMDDDDYYPPNRVSHAVEKLLANPTALCAGSSKMFIWFKHINQMWQFGPYGPNHATAGTFAFKRALLNQTKYDDDACLAEEKAFLKNYTIPFVQLDFDKSILVFSHEHNTFDKRKLLEQPHPDYCKPSSLTVDDFIKEPELKKFFMNDIENLLKNYAPGRPEMKPDVLKQTLEIEQRRKIELEKYQKQMANNQTNEQVRVNYEAEINKLKKQLETNEVFMTLMKNRIKEKDELIRQLREKLDSFMKNYKENISMTVSELTDNGTLGKEINSTQILTEEERLVIQVNQEN